jgi:hypothetical protein
MYRIGAFTQQPPVRQHFIFAKAVTLNHYSLSSAQGGGAIRLNASTSFGITLSRALARITGLITSKLDDFFELSEYDWTPKTREDAPSMYLYELVNWLTTVVDSLVIKEAYKDEAYKGAVSYIAECFMVSTLMEVLV